MALSITILKVRLGQSYLVLAVRPLELEANSKLCISALTAEWSITYPMSEALADLIDIGVMYPKARSQLKLMNVDVPWEFIEKKYKNIDPEGQEKRRIEQEEKAKREQQRLAAEKSYVDEISKTLIKKKIQMEEFNHE